MSYARVRAVIFDVDGVLLDARASYHAVAEQAAQRAVQEVLGRTDAPFDRAAEVPRFKAAGRFNDDWEMARGIALLLHLRRTGKAPPLGDFLARAEGRGIEGLAEVSDDACYRAMDFLHAALPGLQERVFFTVASLLDLEVDLLFFDTSSTYWETDRLPEELQDEGEQTDNDQELDQEPALVESGRRRYSKNSKDHRPDLPQVVVGMAVTRKGIPVRVWTFPGNASDQVIIRKVKDDLRGWNLARVIWVLDRGFTSERNRRYLQRAGGHYIFGDWQTARLWAAGARGAAGVEHVDIDRQVDGTPPDRLEHAFLEYQVSPRPETPSGKQKLVSGP